MRGDLTEIRENTEKQLDFSGDFAAHKNLRGISRLLADLLSSPNLTVLLLVIPVSLSAWAWMYASEHGARSMADPAIQFLIATNAALCDTSISLQQSFAIFMMWLAMAFAMMLPSAVPMLRTYADIADAAVQKGAYAVSIVVLASGYIAVWAGFSAVISLMLIALFKVGIISHLHGTVGGISGGIVLIIAGIYQFAPLKDACLVKCKNPFTTLFAQWSTKPIAVFRLGVQQGLYCLGCCWALMLIMLVTGMVSLVWMALLTLFMILEKTVRGTDYSRVSGVVLLAWGLFFVLTSANLTLS